MNRQAPNEIPSDLADRLGHELRTPMTVIRGYAEALSDDSGLSAQQRQWLDAILRGVTRMEDAVDRLESELRERPAA